MSPRERISASTQKVNPYIDKQAIGVECSKGVRPANGAAKRSERSLSVPEQRTAVRSRHFACVTRLSRIDNDNDLLNLAEEIRGPQSAVPSAPPPVRPATPPTPVAAPQTPSAPLDNQAASTAQPAEPAAQPALGDLGLTTPTDPLEQQLLAAGAAPVLRAEPDSAASLPTLPPVVASQKPSETRPANAPEGVALRQRWETDFPSVEREYSRLTGDFDSRGGTVLNTDIARELSPDYRADRSKSANVHEAASEFVKQLYAKKLAEPTPAGKDPVVLLTAGGTGAGKTTGERAMGDALGSPEIIYDTNMNGLESSEKKIEQALAAGREVDILYTYRDPVESLTGGALPRAMRMEAEAGTGRTVPLSEHAKTHVGSYETIKALREKYANDPRVRFTYFDNSRGKGNGKFVQFADLPSLVDDSAYGQEPERSEAAGVHAPVQRGSSGTLEARLREALDAEHQAGRISDAVYRGFAGQDPVTPAPAVSRPRVSDSTAAAEPPSNLRTHAMRLQAGITAALTASNRGRKGGSKVRVFYSAKDAIAAGFDVQDDQDGFYEPTTGTIGVIADQTDSLARGLWVALHEQSGHHGLRETFNNDAALEAELGRAGTNPIVRAVAEAMQRDRANRGRMDDALAVEEALAELGAAVKTDDWSEIKGRYGVDASDLAKAEVGGVMRRMLRAIRAAISRVAGSSSAYSNEDVMALLENSHKAGLRAKPHASARASTQPRASKTRDSRTRQSPTVMFEVAPDPSDVALTAQWNRLSSERKVRVSEEIANRIVPRVAELFGTSGKFVMQSGGYEGATNPSMALEVENPTRIVEIAKALGHVLSQDSMMVVSPVEVAGTERVGVVTIELQDGIADEDVAALYDRLWEMERDGQKLIGGHTTANGKMAILNYSGIDTKTLAEMVNDHLDNQYTVRSESAYAAFPQKEDYGYASDTQQGAAAAGSSVRAGVDRLRAEASRQIGRRLGTLASTSRQGLRDRPQRTLASTARRSDAAGNRRTRGVAAPQGRGSSGEAWHGRAPRPGAVNVRGVHYSNTAGLKTLAGSKYGTNHRGAEARRLNDDAWRDTRYEVLKNRVYFYPDDSKLAARGETIVGRAAVYEQSFDNIYDSETDPRDLWDMASERSDEDGVSEGGAFEYIVHKAGYDGYRTDDMMVVIGRKAVPVKPLATKASTRKPTINELGMYSAVEKAVLEMPLPAWKKEDGSAAGADVWAKLRTMPGVKQEELKWLGIEDFLLYPHSSQETAPPKFTREKVAEFVRNNGVNIEMVLADQQAVDEDGEITEEVEAKVAQGLPTFSITRRRNAVRVCQWTRGPYISACTVARRRTPRRTRCANSCGKCRRRRSRVSQRGRCSAARRRKARRNPRAIRKTDLAGVFF